MEDEAKDVEDEYMDDAEEERAQRAELVVSRLNELSMVALAMVNIKEAVENSLILGAVLKMGRAYVEKFLACFMPQLGA